MNCSLGIWPKSTRVGNPRKQAREARFPAGGSPKHHGQGIPALRAATLEGLGTQATIRGLPRGKSTRKITKQRSCAVAKTLQLCGHVSIFLILSSIRSAGDGDPRNGRAMCYSPFKFVGAIDVRIGDERSHQATKAGNADCARAALVSDIPSNRACCDPSAGDARREVSDDSIRTLGRLGICWVRAGTIADFADASMRRHAFRTGSAARTRSGSQPRRWDFELQNCLSQFRARNRRCESRRCVRIASCVRVDVMSVVVLRLVSR